MLIKSARPLTLGLMLLAACLASPAFGGNANKSIRVGSGMQTDGHSTVNGSITVGNDATIDGSLSTVNGAITVGDNTRLKNAETVNGSVRLGAGVSVRNVESVNGSIRLAENVIASGRVEVVNGRISIERGSRVDGDVSNVNGELMIDGAEIGGDMETVNGDVTLTNGAILQGNLTVKEPNSFGFNWGSKDRRKPRVVIGPQSHVAGTLRLEREVELYISESAMVGGVSGEMSLDDAIRFSGARP